MQHLSNVKQLLLLKRVRNALAQFYLIWRKQNENGFNPNPLYPLLPRFLHKVCFLAFTAFLVSLVNAEVQALYPVFQDRLFTVRSLTFCDSVTALINPVTALACSVGCFKVICWELPCKHQLVGTIPTPAKESEDLIDLISGRFNFRFSICHEVPSALEGGKHLSAVRQHNFGTALLTHIHPQCTSSFNPIHVVLP